MLRPHLTRRLVLAQAFECGLPHHAIAGPARELDLGDQLRLDPGPVLALARRVLAAERASISLQRVELLEQGAGVALVEARADAARMDEVIAAVHADQQRAQVVRAAAPAADHHLLAGAALGLEPGLGASGLVRRTGALGDDAFEIEVAGGLEDGITGSERCSTYLIWLLMPPFARQQLPEPSLCAPSGAGGAGPPLLRTAGRTRNSQIL